MQNLISLKILIVSVKAGAGHLKVAEALEVYLRENYREIEVKNIDLLDHASVLIKFLYGKAYIDVIKTAPELFAYGYKNYEPTKNFIKPRFLMDKFNFSELFKLVDEFNPDIVIATHFIPAAILANYKEKSGKNYKVIETLTDYEFHPLWLADGVDMFFTSTEDVKNELVFYGVDENKVFVSGIPIHPKFANVKNKADLMAKYGLDSNVKTVLISAGSFGLTPLSDAIGDFKRIKENFQILVVCGNNEKLKKEMEDLQKEEPRLKKVFGFVDFMDELMALSDILITKPGGVTVSEALASGLPMILIEPIPGQEEANADYLLEKGVAVKARNLPMLVYKLERLLQDSQRLSLMVHRAKDISQSNACGSIIEILIKKQNERNVI